MLANDIKGFNNYQRAARETAVYPERGTPVGLMYTGLGIAGEAGEVADEIKKMYRNDGELTPARKLKIKKELGDVLWYVAAVCDECGFAMGDVAATNYEKLTERKRAGELKHEH
jgi:NTP pyrophosphatase (non-canonical NTP hydrolase)